MNKTKKLALGGLITALCSVLMISSNIITIGLFIFPAIAGIMLYVFSFLSEKSYAVYAFFAVAIISFIMCSDKETVMCYIFFLGYYPIAKSSFEKLKPKAISYLIKYIVFNLSAVLIYYLMLFVFGMKSDAFEFFGINMPLVFLFLFNIVFAVYDYTLTLFDLKYKPGIVKIVTKMFK